MEHDTQPHQGDQHQLVEKEMRNHGKTPSYRWKNESILPDLSGCRISRTLQVHDPLIWLFILLHLSWPRRSEPPPPVPATPIKPKRKRSTEPKAFAGG